MKALCIDDKPKKADNPFFKIKAGETYEVEDAGLGPITNIPQYFLPELNQHYHKRRFIPLSDIDEKDIYNEREIIEHETN